MEGFQSIGISKFHGRVPWFLGFHWLLPDSRDCCLRPLFKILKNKTEKQARKKSGDFFSEII
jgi:hypothetical protein